MDYVFIIFFRKKQGQVCQKTKPFVKNPNIFEIFYFQKLGFWITCSFFRKKILKITIKVVKFGKNPIFLSFFTFKCWAFWIMYLILCREKKQKTNSESHQVCEQPQLLVKPPNVSILVFGFHYFGSVRYCH